MTRRIFFSFLIGAAVLSAAGCKSAREVEGDRDVPSRKTDEILAHMQEAELRCEWVSIKYDVEIKTEKVDDSFKMYIRMKQDSVIWVSATYYAVEVARFLFTPDTVKFMDRKNNQFYIGNYDYIQERFNIEVNFDILESLILSNSTKLLSVEAESEKIRSSKDEGMYYVSFLKKGQIRRALRRDDIDEALDLNVGFWVDPSSFRLQRTRITDLESDRVLTAEYADFQASCNSVFPYTTMYTAQSSNEQAKVKTSVMKFSTGKEVSLSFTIPEKYEALVP